MQESRCGLPAGAVDPPVTTTLNHANDNGKANEVPQSSLVVPEHVGAQDCNAADRRSTSTEAIPTSLNPIQARVIDLLGSPRFPVKAMPCDPCRKSSSDAFCGVDLIDLHADETECQASADAAAGLAPAPLSAQHPTNSPRSAEDSIGKLSNVSSFVVAEIAAPPEDVAAGIGLPGAVPQKSTNALVTKELDRQDEFNRCSDIAEEGIAIGLLPSSLPTATTCIAVLKKDQTPRRYHVRCRGRWRMRSAPQVCSRVVGTIAAGSIVVAVNVVTQSDNAEVGSQPWVQVMHIEAKTSSGVLLRTRCSEGIFCYRRNQQGHGLYEIGVEPDDEFRTLTGELASSDSEDTSTTWKILGAAEAVSEWFNDSNWNFTQACSAVTRADKEKPAHKTFEKKQREQLLNCARSLCARLGSLASRLAGPCPESSGKDLLTSALAAVALPTEVAKRFQRLRTLVTEAEEDPFGRSGSAGSGRLPSAVFAAASASRMGAMSEAPLQTCGDAAAILDRLQACRKVDSWLQRDIVATVSTIESELETQRKKLKKPSAQSLGF